MSVIAIAASFTKPKKLEQLVVSCCDASELLELVEEPLDAISFLVEGPVIGVLVPAIALGRDDRFGAGLQDGIVGTIGEDGTGAIALDEVLGTTRVVFLAWPGDQAQRVAQSVAGGVQLGAQPAARATKTLGMRPPPFDLAAPAACW